MMMMMKIEKMTAEEMNKNIMLAIYTRKFTIDNKYDLDIVNHIKKITHNKIDNINIVNHIPK